MDEKQTTQNKNIKELTVSEFILLISGHDYGYIYPSTNQKANEDEGIRIATEIGEPYSLLPITMPDPAWVNKKVMGFDGIDSTKPLINKIFGAVKLNPTTLRGILKERSNKPESIGYLKSVLIPRSVQLQDCHFYGSIDFEKVQSESDIIFNSCRFYLEKENYLNTTKTDFSFSESKFKNIIFRGNQEGSLIKEDYINELSFRSVTTGSIVLSGQRINTLNINIFSGEIKDINIYNCSIKEIIIRGITNKTSITIINLKDNEYTVIDNCTNLYISNSLTDIGGNKNHIRCFEISFSSYSKDSRFIIQNTSIENLHMSGIFSGDALIKDCIIEEFNLFELSNIGNLRFHNIRNIEKFVLTNTSLGKADFINVSVRNSKFVQVITSVISDINIHNTIFPSNLIALDKDDYIGIKEVFRQLKLASGKQGDLIRELEYKVLEMSAYEKDKSINKSLADRFILFTNKISNNYGSNWVRAFLWNLLITIFLFVIIKILIGYTFIFRIGMPDFESISEYIIFSLNPLHDFNRVFEGFRGNNVGLAKLIDSVARFSSGYLLYQFVQAFRKFSK